jgi:hypothetical protein
LIWSIVLMGAAYVMSCGTRLYDVPAETTQAWLAERTALTELAAANEKSRMPRRKRDCAEIGERNRVLNSNKFPSDPVWPAKERWAGKGITNLLAEPPLFGRPPNPERDAALASVKGDDDLQTRRAKKNYPDDWYYRSGITG